jgi:hypothetical protein
MSLVPAEYIGLARAFRSAAMSEHPRAVALMDRIVAPLRGRFHARQTPTSGAFARIASSWAAQVPEAGRLSLATNATPRRLTITETRLAPSKFNFDHWADGDKETAVVITRTDLTVTLDRFHFDMAPIASVPLHGLARRYQRGWTNSAAAIKADLCALATTPEHVFMAGGDFSVPAADDGKWVGVVTEIDHQGTPWLLLVVRTFRDAGMSARATQNHTETMELSV